MIPWRLYVGLMGQVPALSGLDRLVQAQAVAAGIAISMSEKGARIEKALNAQAFPEGV